LAKTAKGAPPVGVADLATDIERRLTRNGVLTVVPGALAVSVFVVFLLQVIVAPGDRLDLVLRGAIGGLFYVPLSLWIGTWWSKRLTAPIFAWVREGRTPDAAEREAALRLPLRCAGIDATFWLIGALLSSLLVLDYSFTLASVIFDSIVLGGVTTCALGYLLTERIWRPVVALALAAGPPARPVTPGVGARLMMAWALATGVPLIGIFAVASAGVLGADGWSQALPGAVAFLSITAIGSGLLATFLVARSVTEPVAAVGQALAKVEGGELDVEVPVDDGSEIGVLQSGFNRMAGVLREQRRIREVFGRHVGRDVAHAALDGQVELGGEMRDVAVLFIDLVGSTAMATDRDPMAVVELLNAFFAIVVAEVEAEGGWVNKFEGDAALSVFGAPSAHRDPAGAALRAARRLQQRLDRELPEVEAGIGISAGPAVAGNIGTEERSEYTVIGDPVNEAARLCDLAKHRPERVLASEAALRQVTGSEAARWSLGEDVTLRGRSAATTLATHSVSLPS
jgi:class 3 adenylate cyclase